MLFKYHYISVLEYRARIAHPRFILFAFITGDMDWKPLLLLGLVGLSWVIFIYHFQGGNKGAVWMSGLFISLAGSTGIAFLGTFLSIEQSLHLWMGIICGVIMMLGGIVMWMGKSGLDTYSASPR